MKHMKKTNHYLIVILLVIYLILSEFCMSYAANVKVTDENLEKATKDLIEYSKNSVFFGKKYEVTLENKKLIINVGGEKYTIDYDLTNKPKFTYEAEFNKNTKFEEFKNKTDIFGIPMINIFSIVSNIQGNDFIESYIYATKYIDFNKILPENNMFFTDNPDVKSLPGDTNITVYSGERDQKVLEYIEALFSNKIAFDDSNGLNLLKYSLERKDVTATSCKLVVNMEINPDGDFSKLHDYLEEISSKDNKISNNEETKDNNDKSVDTEQNEKSEVTKGSTIPRTGIVENPLLIVAYVLIGVSLLGIIALILTRKDV